MLTLSCLPEPLGAQAGFSGPGLVQDRLRGVALERVPSGHPHKHNGCPRPSPPHGPQVSSDLASRASRSLAWDPPLSLKVGDTQGCREAGTELKRPQRPPSELRAERRKERKPQLRQGATKGSRTDKGPSSKRDRDRGGAEGKERVPGLVCGRCHGLSLPKRKQR